MITGPTPDVLHLMESAQVRLQAAQQAHADAQRALSHAAAALLKAQGVMEFLRLHTGQPANGAVHPEPSELAKIS